MNAIGDFVGESALRQEFGEILHALSSAETWVHEIIRLRGDPGYGKTTWCRYWRDHLLGQAGRSLGLVPILVSRIEATSQPGRDIYRSLFGGSGGIDEATLRGLASGLDPSRYEPIRAEWAAIGRAMRKMPKGRDWDVFHRFLSGAPLTEGDAQIVSSRTSRAVDPGLFDRDDADWTPHVADLLALVAASRRGVVVFLDEAAPASIEAAVAHYQELVQIYNLVSDRGLKVLLVETATPEHVARSQPYLAKYDRRAADWELRGVADPEEVETFGRTRRRPGGGSPVTVSGAAARHVFDRLGPDRSRSRLIRLLEELDPYVVAGSVLDEEILRRAGWETGGHPDLESDLREELKRWHCEHDAWRKLSVLGGGTNAWIREALHMAALGESVAASRLALCALARAGWDTNRERAPTLTAGVLRFKGMFHLDEAVQGLLAGDFLTPERRDAIEKGSRDLVMRVLTLLITRSTAGAEV